MAIIIPQERTTLEIQKLQDGGYLVCEGFRGSQHFTGLLFACTDIGEALTYIRNSLEPKPSR